jgi:hypothetical protein
VGRGLVVRGALWNGGWFGEREGWRGMGMGFDDEGLWRIREWFYIEFKDIFGLDYAIRAVFV